MSEIELLQPNKIIKSNRKTISIEITSNGDMIVRAPYFSSTEQINKFIVDKAKWIIQKRIEYKAKSPKLDLSDGSKILILDKEYEVQTSQSNRIVLKDGVLYLPEPKRFSLKLILKKLLKNYITEKVKEYSSLYGFNYSSITISEAKTNWGSCSYSNRLHFTFRLALCPLYVVDYIVLHELSHTKIKNHSKSFYNLIISIMPDYKKANKFLKDNRHIMELI